jgi:hypothetical protein
MEMDSAVLSVVGYQNTVDLGDVTVSLLTPSNDSIGVNMTGETMWPRWERSFHPFRLNAVVNPDHGRMKGSGKGVVRHSQRRRSTRNASRSTSRNRSRSASCGASRGGAANRGTGRGASRRSASRGASRGASRRASASRQ